MAKNANSGNSMTAVQKVSGGARIADAVLAVIFLGLAVYSGWWFWWVSAAFCAFTAVTNPVEKLAAYMRSKLVQTKPVR